MKLTTMAAKAAAFTLTAVAFAAQATTYYVASDGTGNDTTHAGLSETDAWATLTKASNTPVAGDTVLFKNGNVWEGTLRLKDGVRYSNFNPSSGVTSQPIIRGSTSVGGLNWSKLGTNVWAAPVPASFFPAGQTDMYGNPIPPSITQLHYQGIRLQRAAYPFNSGGGSYKKGLNRFFQVGPNTTHANGPTQTIDTNQPVKMDDGSTQTVASLLSGKDVAGADVFVKNNDWYMTRYKMPANSAISPSWPLITAIADTKTQTYTDYATDRHAMHDLDWPGSVTEAIQAGFGYRLEGKPWMIHAEGEWAYDNGMLYVWPVGGVSPQGGNDYLASVYANAITGFNVASANIDNIEVRETRGDAIRIDGYDKGVSSLNISNSTVYRAGRAGIAVVNTNNTGTNTVGTITGNKISDTINEGIDIGGDRIWATTRTRRINVTNNNLGRIGNNYFARGAIVLGHRENAIGNTINSAVYSGISGGKINTIQKNVIKNICMQFDDCGAIYTLGRLYPMASIETGYTGSPNDVNSIIDTNIIDAQLIADDRLDGSPSSNGQNDGARSTNVGGVYLDDYSSSLTVSNNYISGVDYGVGIHHGSNNSITGNNMVGNRRAVRMQENLDSSIVMQGNAFSSNVMASSSSEAVIDIESSYGRTAGFGSYTSNKYATYRSPVFAVQSNHGSGKRLQTFAQWQASGRDSGSTLFTTGYGIKALAGAPAMLSNGVFTSSTQVNTWSGDNALLSYESPGFMLVQPKTNATERNSTRRLFSAWTGGNISLEKGVKYWLSFDVYSDIDTELMLNFRRFGPTYDDVSIPIFVQAGTTRQTVSRLITAQDTLSNATLNIGMFNDPGVALAGSRVHLANVSLIKADLNSGSAGPTGAYNATTQSVTANCPFGLSLCTTYKDLRTNVAGYPFTLSPWSHSVFVQTHASWLDTDRDGVPNSLETGGCTNTADGIGVKENGC